MMSNRDELWHNSENMRFQRHEWRWQRIGWAIMLLLILAAVAGLTGPGPASNAVSGRPGDPVQLHYQRFEHWHRDSEMTLTIDPSAVHGGQAHVWMNRAMLENVDLSAIHPAPMRMDISPNRVTYTFSVADASGPLTVVFAYQADDFGLIHGRIGADGYAADFWQWVYP